MTYAFGLLDQFRRLCAEMQGFDLIPGRAFVQWLLDNRRLTELDTVRPDALTLYFDDGRWTHAGVTLRRHRIRSKWGTYAAFEHALSEIPADYGDLVKDVPAAKQPRRSQPLLRILLW